MRTKGDQALLTISELAEELGVGSHILRYWENHFPALRPLQRAGNRRYYRPDDVALAHQINHLLKKEGYTVRGAVKFLSSETQKRTPIPVSIVTPSHQTLMPEKWVEELRYISEMLSSALMVE
ncbi:MAG: MerR family transcriptional regulator [Zymomonas mobilis subsp. pomaceae]|uniref:MerR family transcriptional regulator n=1 Tax=Zymomonas mobilis TaxID=542 RepID=UPI00059F1CA5|nr:MerR family transcriptional regulator [Zymomonas mobilis]MDX5948449.1 MerR family transcriptional regulator [Zymomonas mobilis subsp. pomaceae]